MSVSYKVYFWILAANLDLFSSGDMAMVVGYPRMLQEISDRGYSKKFLLASSFPHYA